MIESSKDGDDEILSGVSYIYVELKLDEQVWELRLKQRQ